MAKLYIFLNFFFSESFYPVVEIFFAIKVSILLHTSYVNGYVIPQMVIT